MLRVHETVRRRVCRLAFCLIAVVPVVSFASWAVWRQAPPHASSWERWISAEVGLTAELGDVSHPRPGEIVFHDLRLKNPLSGELVLLCPALEAKVADGGILLTPTLPEIKQSELKTLWSCIDRRLLGQCANSSVNVKIEHCNVIANGGADSLTWQDFSASIETQEFAAAGAQFRIAGEGETPSDLIELRAMRRRGKENGLEISLDTGSSLVPCALVAPLFDVQEWLGTESAFAGEVAIAQSVKGSEGYFRGHCEGVNLESFVRNHFSHFMTGTASVTVEESQWNEHGLTKATCDVRCGDGVVGQSLLDSATKHLRLNSNLARQTAPLVFSELGMRLTIDAGGLQMEGICDSSPGALLVADGPQFLNPPFELQPAVNLINALSPASEYLAPATEQSLALMKFIPLPSSAPHDETVPPTARAIRAHSKKLR